MKKILFCFIFLALFFKGKTQIDSLRINPNPFDTTTTVYYSLANSDSTTLQVFDSFGTTIKVFFSDSFINVGAYTINYNTSILPNGVYFFRLKIGANSIIKKGIKTTTNGIAKNTSSKILLIYPNPAPNSISLEIPLKETPLDRSKVTPAFRCKLTPLFRSKLTPAFWM